MDLDGGVPCFPTSHISCLPVQSFINWINIPWQNSSWMRYFEHFRATSWVHIRLRFHVKFFSPCIEVWGDLHCKTRGYFSTADSSIDSRKNLEKSRCCCCSSKKTWRCPYLGYEMSCWCSWCCQSSGLISPNPESGLSRVLIPSPPTKNVINKCDSNPI